ncbi:SIR2 family protein [Flavobacterium hydatis]|uniref:Uncharacterized protein n=1 Tax=Flavobacterium hydatis TaxID=991 RepID=A0A086AR10_FLAHY|nr:SIR2 family protein [Flavobacterium hydatis]KFF19124.1 hypothetical protein IW20_04005 [Flavobacterium hydatis]OXA93541.1 hypothetical protein B0A62_12350 [Flavobacterium hydatis]
MTEEKIIPEKLEEAIRNNNLVFFIGAGCSIPLKFPSWKSLIEDILKELISKYGATSDTNFQNILNGVQSGSKTLFEALNIIERDAKNGPHYKIKSKEIINKQIESISKNLPTESQVHDLIWKISEKIITTNYDKALEKYKPEKLNPKIFDNTNTFQSLKSQSKEAQFLYKIHGDCDNPHSIILFESDYRDLYKNSNHNNDAFSDHFKNKTFLFVGFSLSDPFVNDLFTKIKTIYDGYTINEHFIFTTKDDDFIEYDVNSIKIENWEDSLTEYLLLLEKIKLSCDKDNIELSILPEQIKEELNDDDLITIVKLAGIKTKELSNNPGDKELHKEVNDLRAKINKVMFGEIDYLQEVKKTFRDTDLQALFEVIYFSQKIDKFTLERIQKVRTNIQIYKWHDRSVIVSAITCSLIHFDKIDQQKISLLIDFINDNENKVWQKAITCLFMVLNHLGNKWLKFDFIKTKIKSLNENLVVQNACANIVHLFAVGLDRISIDEELFNNPYFNENAFNYFLPYYQENNIAFEQVYDNYTGNDIESFISFLNEVPIPDQLKYLYCEKFNLDENTDENTQEENEKISNKMHHILHLNSVFYPYSIHVQELISFYKYFPRHKHKEKLKSQLKLTETPLKNYLLNTKQKYSALGSHFMQEKNWAQAIVNYKEAIKLDENNIADLMNLASCYHLNKDYDDEICIRIKITSIESDEENNLNALFDLYFTYKKDFTNSLDISNKLLAIHNDNADYFNYQAISLKNLKEYEKALEAYNEAIRISPKDSSFYTNRAIIYFYELKNIEMSIRDWNSAIEFQPDNDINYFNRALIFYELKEFVKSNNDLDIAYSINKKELEYLISKAANYMYLSLFKEALSNIKEAESLGCDKDVIYHTYSNYYRLTGDFDKALEYISKAESLKKDVKLIGTKATIYSSMGNDEKFYEYLEESFREGAEAMALFPDIKDKYEAEPLFLNLLKKYNQDFYIFPHYEVS